MVTVGRVCQLTLLGNNTNSGFVGGYNDSVDLVEPVFNVWMKRYSRLGSRLGVELCREGNLEQNVFHHVRAKCLRQGKLALIFRLESLIFVGFAEQYVVEAPLLSCQYTGNTHLAAHGNIRQANGP